MRRPGRSRGGGIRRATAADLPRLFEIRNAVAENRLDEPWDTFVDIARWYLERNLVWVVTAPGRGPVLGFGAADTRSGAVEVLYVDPRAEGRGIGRTLLRRCCDDLLRAGYRRAWLVTQRHTRAERVYREAGWLDEGDDGVGGVRFSRRLA